MATRNEQWLEDFDNLIYQVPGLFLPEPVRDAILAKLEQVQEEIQEEFELRSTDWEALTRKYYETDGYDDSMRGTGMRRR
jgi:hypothetical protein